MGDYFHQMNKHILKFDCNNDIEKIKLNHYIMRKVNKNNIDKKLPKGCFEITRRNASKDLNLSRSNIDRMIRNFEELEIIEVVKLGKNENQGSIYRYITPKNLETANKTLDDTVNETIKLSEFKNLKDVDETLIGTVNETLVETTKINTLNKYLNIYTSVVEYLNNKTKKNFKVNTKKTISLINARLNEGFNLDDFYKVIDTKSKQWLNTNMEKYLRPETLFSNKFEGYLNEKSTESDDLESIEPWSVDFKF